MKNKRSWLVFLLICCLMSVSFLILDHYFPFPGNLVNKQFAVVITASDGSPLRAFPDPQGIWRYPISLQQVSPLYVEALLSYEDRWFYYHPGFNPLALIRACFQFIWHGRAISGASTLTMQVARVLEPHPKTIPGKLRQIFRALQLEYHLSKDEILTLYLNNAPFGGVIEGVQTASYAYLGKAAHELSHAEAALLAVMPQSPSRFRPDRYPERARKARNKLLDRMVNFDIWDADRVKDAKHEQVLRYYEPYPYIAPLLARRLKNQHPDQQLIRSTIDFNLQQQLEQLVQQYIQPFPAQTSAALLVVDHSNMSVKAYIGSADFLNQRRFGYIDMIKATRSPGSTLKPFLYGIAIEQGLIHSASLLVDTPQIIGHYQPENFDRHYSGPVSVTRALQRSLNIPAVDILDRLNPKYFNARLAQGGLNLKFPGHQQPSLAMILGGTGVTLENMVKGYSAFANAGITETLKYTMAQHQQPIARRMMSAGAAWMIRHILSSQKRPDIPNHAHIAYDQNRQLAWKTGTSYGYRDAWSIGISQQFLIGVWIGRPDGTPLPGHFGAVSASPLLFMTADRLPRLQRIYEPQPENITQETICWPLGIKPKSADDPLCHQSMKALILDQQIPPTLPERDDRLWQNNPLLIQLNNQGQRVTPMCKSSSYQALKIARWPVSLYPWLSPSIRAKAKIPAIAPECQQYAKSNPISQPKIMGLEDRQLIHSSANQSKLPTIELTAQGGGQHRFWLMNGELIAHGKTHEVKKYTFNHPGQYALTVIDDYGQSDSIKFRVMTQ